MENSSSLALKYFINKQRIVSEANTELKIKIFDFDEFGQTVSEVLAENLSCDSAATLKAAQANSLAIASELANRSEIVLPSAVNRFYRFFNSFYVF